MEVHHSTAEISAHLAPARHRTRRARGALLLRSLVCVRDVEVAQSAPDIDLGRVLAFVWSPKRMLVSDSCDRVGVSTARFNCGASMGTHRLAKVPNMTVARSRNKSQSVLT